MVGKTFKMKSRFCEEDFQGTKMERGIIVMMFTAFSSLLNDLTLSHRHLTVIQPVPWYQAGAYLILFSREPKAFILGEHKSTSLREIVLEKCQEKQDCSFLGTSYQYLKLLSTSFPTSLCPQSTHPFINTFRLLFY